MRSIVVGLAALSSALAAPALAQDTAPPSPITVTGGATVVSDYRFRGISQSNKRFAMQGTFTVAHESGFYGTVWGSSIDDYVINGADAEIDLIGGYRRTFGGTTLDVGVLYYYYPGSGGVASDFAEPFVALSHTYGPVTAKATVNYAWKQQALSVGSGKEDSLYGALDLSAGLGDSGLAITGHVGRSFERSYITFGEKYWDWNAGLSFTRSNITAAVQYVDTDRRFLSAGPVRNVGKAGVVGSIGVAF